MGVMGRVVFSSDAERQTWAAGVSVKLAMSSSSSVAFIEAVVTSGALVLTSGGCGGQRGR
jgi:hypothetical protein